MKVKVQGSPRPFEKGRYKFLSQYGCHGTLYFWLLDPPAWKVHDTPEFDALKKAIIDELQAQGNRHVYYRPLPP